MQSSQVVFAGKTEKLTQRLPNMNASFAYSCNGEQPNNSFQEDEAAAFSGDGRSIGEPLKCFHGGVSSSQPLASKAGLEILRKGGNAAG